MSFTFMSRYCSKKKNHDFACFQELENPLILIYEKKISDMKSLVRILELAVKVRTRFLPLVLYFEYCCYK